MRNKIKSKESKENCCILRCSEVQSGRNLPVLEDTNLQSDRRENRKSSKEDTV
jgi:hypothetical protein